MYPVYELYSLMICWTVGSLFKFLVLQLTGLNTVMPAAFNFTCPEAVLRKYRSKMFCADEKQYHCMYDTLNHGYSETCMHAQPIGEGKYSVLSGNLDVRECHQPFYSPYAESPVWSNEGHRCYYLRTLCNEEGQVIVSNGSSSIDRLCRCDYTRGYDYITKPKDPCKCSPSTEDCTCFIRFCPGRYNKLNQDYRCEDKQKEEYECSAIVSQGYGRMSTIASDSPIDTCKGCEAKYTFEPISRPVTVPMQLIIVVLTVLTVCVVSLFVIYVLSDHSEGSADDAFISQQTPQNDLSTPIQENVDPDLQIPDFCTMADVATMCNDCGNDRDLESCCVQCEQLYCKECTQHHRRLKATHVMVDASHTERNLAHSSIDVACGNECGVTAVGLCLKCKQVFCDNCIQRQYRLIATKTHLIITAKGLEPQGNTSSVGQDRKYLVSYPQSQMSHALANVQKMKGPYDEICTNEFMISVPDDKEGTRVRGIAVLNTDGKTWKIVVADYRNRSLKLFNSAFQHVTSKELKEYPRGIAAISNDHVAVTIADKKEIRIYKIEASKICSQKNKTIKMKEKPFSIAFNKDHLAVETGEGEDGAIRILDICGKEHFFIPGNTSKFGRFTGNTIRLALDYSKQLVFVVDITREVVHRVTFTGTINWTVQIKSPRGVALHDNVLFVASRETNNIYQMNATDGMLFRFLDEDNRITRPRCPRYIAYNHDLRRLAVEIDGNHIKVYGIDRFQKE